MATVSFDNTENAFAYKSDKELKKAKFLYSTMSYPFFVPISTKITPLLIKGRLPFINKIVRNTIFKQFVGGETLEDTKPICTLLGQHGVNIILDYGVEGKQGEVNFDQATEEFIHAINYAASQQNIPFISVKVTGIARFGLLNTLDEAPRLRSGIHDNEAETQEWERVKDRIYAICASAAEKNIGVLIDAEESWIQDPIDRLAMEMMAVFNKEKAVVFNTIQLYRHDRLEFLKLSHKIATQQNFQLGVKLVRGAYMEKERARATNKHYPCPIQKSKEHTDIDFDAAVEYCIDNINTIHTIIASHNEESNLKAFDILVNRQIPLNHEHIHFSQLYGMRDNISFNLAKEGCNVSKYLPFGPIKDVIPYLMRRAQENSSLSKQTNRELALLKRELNRRKS
ncbi:MAG: proline dehydrogenase family protein [Chitinophagaceae bacterium]|nr:proline dehydrogenase family protein [Chitinophagaceae bacterium]MCW5904658.1 proline dehydrogenase family protein [Chitinophagaceae bacterium]